MVSGLYVKCIFNLGYFQLTTGLSGQNPIVSWGTTVYQEFSGQYLTHKWLLSTFVKLVALQNAIVRTIHLKAESEFILRSKIITWKIVGE